MQLFAGLVYRRYKYSMFSQQRSLKRKLSHLHTYVRIHPVFFRSLFTARRTGKFQNRAASKVVSSRRKRSRWGRRRKKRRFSYDIYGIEERTTRVTDDDDRNSGNLKRAKIRARARSSLHWFELRDQIIPPPTVRKYVIIIEPRSRTTIKSAPK